MEEEKYRNLKLGEHGAIISIVAYIILSCLKLFIGYISGSEALKADGLNNSTDIVASVAVLIGLRISQRPPDNDHAYGHWKSENIASLVASFIMFAVGLQVLIQGVSSLFQKGNESPDLLAGYVGIFSAICMYFVYRYNNNLAKKIHSQSLMAAAKDNMSDAWVSVGAAISVFASQFHMPWLDIVTAIIIGTIICNTAWGIFKEASHQLTDGFDKSKIELYKQTISTIKSVKGIKEMKGRYYGNNPVIDIVIVVDPDLDIHQAHEISTLVEHTLMKEHNIFDVHVHVEPLVESVIHG